MHIFFVFERCIYNRICNIILQIIETVKVFSWFYAKQYNLNRENIDAHDDWEDTYIEADLHAWDDHNPIPESEVTDNSKTLAQEPSMKFKVNRTPLWEIIEKFRIRKPLRELDSIINLTSMHTARI